MSGRDYNKNAYLTIVIPKKSETYKALVADAKNRGISQLPTLAGIRVGDYYQMVALLASKGLASAIAGIHDAPIEVLPEQETENEEQLKLRLQQQKNAKANANVWDD